MEVDLSGRTAVVTGGTRGIGRAISLGFADAGANVVPLSRTESDVERTAEAVRERGVDRRRVDGPVGFCSWFTHVETGEN